MSYRQSLESPSTVQLGKHSLTWGQHIVRIEKLLRISERFPNWSIVPAPIGLRKRNRARRQPCSTHIARPLVESAIHRDHGRDVRRSRQIARKLESDDQIFVRQTHERTLDPAAPPCRKAWKGIRRLCRSGKDSCCIFDESRCRHAEV